MSRPDLSIIVVNWNTRALLFDCLTALEPDRQTLELQIIVVDNGSTDDSLAMISSSFPHVLTIANGQNLGFSVANNLGVQQATGRHVLFLNSDTIVQPAALVTLVDYLDTHTDAGAVGPQLLNADGSLQPSGRPLPTLLEAWRAIIPLGKARRERLKSTLEKRDYDQITAVGELSGAALMVKKEILDQIGVFDERFFFLGEDIDLCWRIQKAGWQIFYVPTAKITHLWGGSSQGLSEKHSLLAQRAYLRLMQKHGRPLDGILFTFLGLMVTEVKAARRVVTALWRKDTAALWGTIRLHGRELIWLFINGWRRAN